MPPRLRDAKAEAIMRAAGREPLERYPGRHTPWRSRCIRCGTERSPTLGNVLAARIGCGDCAGNVAYTPVKAEAIMRAAGFVPLVDFPGTKASWRCRCVRCGRAPKPWLSNVVQGGGCDHCSGKAEISVGLAVAAMRATGLEPRVPYPGDSRVQWDSRCTRCGSPAEPWLSNIRTGHGGCRDCGGNAPIPPARAEVIMRSLGLEPLAAFPGADRAWNCRCVGCGIQTAPRISDAVRHPKCGGCAGRFTRFRVPEAIMRAAGLEPLEPYQHKGHSWRCRCLTCGNSTSPTLGSIRHGAQGGCSTCAGNAPVLAARATAILRAVGLEPAEPWNQRGVSEPWPARCLWHGHLVEPRIADLQRGTGCWGCAATGPVRPAFADAVMRAAGIEPLEPYRQAGKRWRCRCTDCGNEIFPSLHKVQHGQGCRHCSDSGLDWNARAVVYVITHREYGAHKIGITGLAAREDRLAGFRGDGWKVFGEPVEFRTGRDAYLVEQAVLRHLRKDLGLPPYLSRDQLPRNGYRETVEGEAISLPALRGLVMKFSKEMDIRPVRRTR